MTLNPRHLEKLNSGKLRPLADDFAKLAQTAEDLGGASLSATIDFGPKTDEWWLPSITLHVELGMQE